MLVVNKNFTLITIYRFLCKF